MPLSRISNNIISDNTITNAKINSSAAIAQSKLGSLNVNVTTSTMPAGTIGQMVKKTVFRIWNPFLCRVVPSEKKILYGAVP